MTSSNDKFQRLKTLLAESRNLEMALDVLEWEQQVFMPPGGAAARAEQTSTIGQLAHERYTAPEVGQLLDELAHNGSLGDYDSDEASIVRVNRREYDRQRRVPGELVGELARASGLAVSAWDQAKKTANYALFQPHLERMFELKRRWAECFQPQDLYDPLLDEYEPGLSTVQARALFAELKAGLVPLVKAIAAKADAVDDSFLHRPYDAQKQWDLGVEMVRAVGFDFERGRIDSSAHPFTAHFSSSDVRLTTRVLPDMLASALASNMHEAGHGLYEQGVSPSLERTWLDEGTSLGVHESQSKLFENHVGRSRAFWQHFFPRVQAVFPEHLAGQNAESFYRAFSKVEPSLIRTEADEVTYDLHIMLRFELEQEMLAGTVDFAALPEIWNARMQEYLGVVPPTDSEGVLQDIHWANGLVGYFATYTVGNVLAAQFFAQASRDIPDLQSQFAQGNFAPLLAWLRENIHRHGRKFTLGELVQRITGGPISATPYLSYLKAKYTELYGLEGL